ncbi:hypothetical protein EQV77_06770 [Halobacillus fulvus]|nr:hypothetical protein EQV77_06770 [Halobacillus fulvus]
MYPWVIIGGGVQGCCIASRLLREKVKKEELMIIDPHSEPMYVWRTLTSKTGMPYLRSPSVHHLAADPYSLKKYSRIKDYAEPFRGNYARPRLDMFNQHSMDELEQSGVLECWLQGEVVGLSKSDHLWEVTLADGNTILAGRIVLAMGVNQSPHYPEWASQHIGHPSILHVFDIEQELPDKGHGIIVGGGMTAAHVAHTLTQSRNIRSATIVKRHDFRIHDFDSDPGWLGPKYLRTYHETKDYKERRQFVKEARYRGSITRDLRTKIMKQKKAGRLYVQTGDINRLALNDNSVQVIMEDGQHISGDFLVLATGSQQKLPGKEWLQSVIDTYDLPCAPCGFPIVKTNLEWMEGLYVSGALAELEIGPVSRNIAGARKAAERISDSA